MDMSAASQTLIVFLFVPEIFDCFPDDIKPTTSEPLRPDVLSEDILDGDSSMESVAVWINTSSKHRQMSVATICT
jgi:hypothetical protein